MQEFDDEYEEYYQKAIDSLDVKYVDGIAYMIIHTVDIINDSLMEVVNSAIESAENGSPTMPIEAVNGMVWVMAIWKNLHDELDVRAEVTVLPDHVPTDLLDK
jgi:hypothetical protein